MASPRYGRLSDEQRVDLLDRAITRAQQRENRQIRRDAARGQIANEEAFDHPQYGRVQIVGAVPNGALRVVRVLPDGTVSGRHFLARSGDLKRVQ
jgi:hypothetical protein